MSATIASGASKPNGAGLPMLSLRILCPSASSRCASTRIGPRTSYRTCCSLRLWTMGRMPYSLAEHASPGARIFAPRNPASRRVAPSDSQRDSRTARMRDIVYPAVVAAAKTWFRLGDVRIVMTGTQHIPREGGALVAVNHLSFVDYVMAGYPGVRRG